MSYICTVITPEFKKRLDEFVEKKCEGTEGFRKSSKRFDVLQMTYELWNNTAAQNLYPNFTKSLIEANLFVPEYTVQIFEPAERGYQSRPRILWNGEVMKLDEIDEIISYHGSE